MSIFIITSDIDTVLAHSSRHTTYLLVHLSRYSLDILSSLFAHLYQENLKMVTQDHP